MVKLCRIAMLAIAAMVLGACASVGPAVKIGVSLPGGEEETIVAHKQSVPDRWLASDKLRLNYIVPGDSVSEKQLAAVDEAERACRIYTGVVRPIGSDKTYAFESCGLEVLSLFSGYGGLRVLQKSPY